MDSAHQDPLAVVNYLNNRQGRKKTLLDQLQAQFVPLLLIAIVGGSNFFWNFSNEKKLAEVSSAVQNIQNLQISVGTGQDAKTESSQNLNNDERQVLGASSTFDLDSWTQDGFEDANEAGYFCPKTSKFDYWWMWSKKSVPLVATKIQIKFLTIAKPGSQKPPTFTIAYGEYRPNLGLLIFYQINVFDTDNWTIRLKNNNESSSQAYLNLEPDINTEMLVTLEPTVLSSTSRDINLNFSFEYAPMESKKITKFLPPEDFIVTVPTVELDDVMKQVGIGVSTDTCFKPISVTFE